MRHARWASIPAALAAGTLAAGVAGTAVPNPAPPQDGPVASVDVTIHTVSGAVIPRGTVVFDEGRIVAVGAEAPVPAGARRVDGTGKHLWPGLMESHSRAGIEEIRAVRATRDEVEVGRITPNVKSWVAVNPESEIPPVTRANGVLLAVTAPQGALLQGLSAVLQLDGWTWEEMTIRAPAALHLVWPAMGIAASPRDPEAVKKATERRRKHLEQVERAFRDARAYLVARRAGAGRDVPPHAIDRRWEAMIPVLEGEIPLVVSASEIRQIQAAVAFAERHGVRLVLHGGYDAPQVAPLLVEHDVAVIVDGTLREPSRRSDPYDTPYTVPLRLHEAGVRFAIADPHRTWAERNLPYEAARAIAFGLPEDVALRAITLTPAEIHGVADRVGSIEVGKDATLFLTDGDLFEIPTRVERAFIRGREIDLTNRQTVLHEKYREKYRRRGLVE